MRSNATRWDQIPGQKHCHPLAVLEGEILDAIDEKASYGDYAEDVY